MQFLPILIYLRPWSRHDYFLASIVDLRILQRLPRAASLVQCRVGGERRVWRPNLKRIHGVDTLPRLTPSIFPSTILLLLQLISIAVSVQLVMMKMWWMIPLGFGWICRFHLENSIFCRSIELGIRCENPRNQTRIVFC